MQGADPKARLGKKDWVLAGLRALVRGGIAGVKVEALAREIGTTKGSFYWHFKDLGEFHQVMLEFWERLATTEITAAVRASGRDGPGQLQLLLDLVSVRPGEVYGGIEVEPALREWGRIDPRARAVVTRVDRQRLADLTDFLAAAGMAKTDRNLAAQTLYAAVLGLEGLRITTDVDMRGQLGSLVQNLLRGAGADGTG
ncbi:MAG: TetR/AcrR family transcriptional regulator [Tabrizicola sp.]|jgi:AcrR family transcriptional regulator|nr:TetR/AcrR family transcriptional regulator [Tabrizicola sp.]